MQNNNAQERPYAASGLTSYRYPSRFTGFIMIGAKDHNDALNEASRSLSDGSVPTIDKLEVWDGTRYTSASYTENANRPAITRPRP